MHFVQQIIWRKTLEEYDEDPNCEKQYDQIFPLNVYFFTYDMVCMQPACATRRDTIHI